MIKIGAHSFGRNFCITIFGESHGPGIGVVIDGIPADLLIDREAIQKDLTRRRPGQSRISTPRDEKDLFEVLSGLQNEKTTGSPLTLYIRNKDTRSKDYSLFREIHRPSQIDYPALLRYGENVDLRGSGKFSGRLTAPIVMAGAVAKSLLKSAGVNLAAFVSQVGAVKDDGSYTCEQILDTVENTMVRTVDPKVAEDMIALIDKVRDDEDSVGGIVSVRVEQYPVGIGDPWFQSLDGDLAAAIMAIPATRGIEFGTGFKAAEMRGSAHNDMYILKDGKVATKTNHCGGIIGGISIGTPIEFRVPIKPTASIGVEQTTLNFKTKKMDSLKIEGRHDPCIVPRALVGIEAITAIVLADHLLASRIYSRK